MSESSPRPAFNELVELPEIRPFPESAQRIIAACKNPDVTARQISDIAHCDPALTLKIVQVANSSVYGMAGNIRTLQHAVVVLGLRTLRDLTLTVAASDVFASGTHGKAHRKALWDHSVAVAAVATLLSRQIADVESDEAFMAGIVHDVGKLVLLDHAPDTYAELRAPHHSGCPLERERNQFGTDHQEVGLQCADDWGLPIEIADAIGLHHDVLSGQVESTLVQVVALSNLLAKQWGLGGSESPELPVEEALDHLSLPLTKDDVENLADQAADEYKELKAAFGD